MVKRSVQRLARGYRAHDGEERGRVRERALRHGRHGLGELRQGGAARLGLRSGGTAHKKGQRRASQPVVQSRVSWRRFAAGAAVGGYRRGEREGASSPVVVAMWRVSLARGCAAMGSNQMPLPMARSVSSSLSFLTRRSLPILMAGIFCRSMSL